MTGSGQSDIERALREIIGAHKRVLGYVTPGHPLMRERVDARAGKLGPDMETYPPDGWSELHRRIDEAAELLGWEHREEVAIEAGKQESAIR